MLSPGRWCDDSRWPSPLISAQAALWWREWSPGGTSQGTLPITACNEPSRRFHYYTRAFSWLKAHTSAFTFETRRMLYAISVIVKGLSKLYYPHWEFTHSIEHHLWYSEPRYSTLLYISPFLDDWHRTMPEMLCFYCLRSLSHPCRCWGSIELFSLI